MHKKFPTIKYHLYSFISSNQHPNLKTKYLNIKLPTQYIISIPIHHKTTENKNKNKVSFPYLERKKGKRRGLCIQDESSSTTRQPPHNENPSTTNNNMKTPKMSTFMNPRGCFMKGNENGTTNGRGRGFLPLYKPQTKKKRRKKGVLLNKVNQGSKLSRREPSWGRRKNKV